jgi:hypothetical protein
MIIDMSDTQWTIESIRDHFNRLIDVNDRRYEQRFADLKVAVDLAFAAQKELVQSALLSAERAVTKAENAAEKRFDSQNEFRGSLEDQARTFMPRAEAEIVFKSLVDRIQALSEFQKIKEGERKGGSDVFAWILAGISVIVAILSVKLKIH